MYCNYCGKVIQDDAHLCAYCGKRVAAVIGRKQLMRKRFDRKVAGVCGGFAEYLDMDVTLVRIIWFFLIVFPPLPGLIAYVIAWVVMPEEPASVTAVMTAPPNGQVGLTNP